MELAIGSIMKEIFEYSNTYPFYYLFGDKELLARQVDFYLLFGKIIVPVT